MSTERPLPVAPIYDVPPVDLAQMSNRSTSSILTGGKNKIRSKLQVAHSSEEVTFLFP